MSARLALRLVWVLAVCAMPAAVIHAQVPAAHPTAVAAKNLPPVPVAKSPVDLFRDLLAMTPTARDQYLATRPPEIRARILEKVAEYAAMKPDERELRLRMTQLRWYLLSFMQSPAGDRAARLAQIPEADRPLVSDHLQQWDQLPPDEQKAILKYEKAMEQFADQNLDAATAATNVSQLPTPKQPAGLQSLDNFLKLPPEERRQMYAGFQKFFGLSDVEKQKTLSALPDTQRQQMVGALRTVNHLSPDERTQYLAAMNRFSNMSDVERKEFLKNAERWQQLSPMERQAWRGLVQHLAKRPPLPPGFISPPMPSNRHLQASATNLVIPSP